MTDQRYDAVVIGAGHNGLVAAIYLARAGWEPLVVERNERIGGAIRSAELTEDGFVHDVYSTNMNLFLDSPVYAELADEFADHGLEFSHTPKPYCNLFPDGTCLRVYQDEERTLEELRAHEPADAVEWERLYEHFERFKRSLLPLYETPLPSVAAGRVLLDAVRNEHFGELLTLGQILASSPRELADAYFETEETRALVASWGLHLDLGPDVPGGAMYPFFESFAYFEDGVALATGGASNVVEALAGVLRDYGGEIRTDAEVQRVVTDDGRAVGVELTSGERIGATRAVVANLTPAVLFDDLLEEQQLPASVDRKVDQYRYGPGTMMVHLSLDDLPNWDAAEDVDEFGHIHIAPYVDDLSTAYIRAINGIIPEHPLLIITQTTAVDPTRTPNDEHILQVEARPLPSRIRGDSADTIEATSWEAAREPTADRIIQLLETYAPEITESIRDRVVHSPADLERDNPNLVGGDSGGGSHHLRQNLVFRPFPGWSRYAMPVDGLYMVGAATWPGAGNNATSGYLAARRILRPTVETRILEYAEKHLERGLQAVRRRMGNQR